MRAFRATMIMGVGAILATSVAWAGPAHQGGRCDRGGRIAQTLGLTDAQKAKIEPIFEKYRGQFQALRGQSLSREQRRARFTELRGKMQAEISPILTREQRDQAAKMREQRASHHGQRDARQGECCVRQGQRGVWQGECCIRQGQRGVWQGRRFGGPRMGFFGGPRVGHFGARPVAPFGGRQPIARRLSRELQLTTDQQQKVKEIAVAHRAAMRSIFQDARSGKLDRSQARNRVQALRKEMHANVVSVLTPEQQQLLQSIRQQHPGRWHRG